MRTVLPDRRPMPVRRALWAESRPGSGPMPLDRASKLLVRATYGSISASRARSWPVRPLPPELPRPHRLEERLSYCRARPGLRGYQAQESSLGCHAAEEHGDDSGHMAKQRAVGPEDGHPYRNLQGRFVPRTPACGYGRFPTVYSAWRIVAMAQWVFCESVGQ